MAFARLAALAAPLQPVIGKRRIALVISAPDRDGAGRTPSISESVWSPHPPIHAPHQPNSKLLTLYNPLIPQPRHVGTT